MKKIYSPDNDGYFWKLSLNGSKSKYQQIFDYIKEGVQEGFVLSKIPSSRVLSNMWNVNRNTIVKAIEELVWEGWLVAIPKKGVYANTNIVNITPKAQKKNYKIPYKLRDVRLDTFSLSNRIIANTDLRYLWQKVLSINSSQLKDNITTVLFSKLGIDNDDLSCYTVPNIFYTNYIISRLLLNNGDEIIVAKNTKQKLLHHLPNLDVKLSALPTINNTVDIKALEKKLANSHQIKFLYLHYDEDEIIYTSLDLINITELCYRYGVLILENITLTLPKEHRVISCKKLDYKHYIISIVHCNLFNNLNYSYVITHQEIGEKIKQYLNNMQVAGDAIQESIVSYLVTNPKLFDKIVI